MERVVKTGTVYKFHKSVIVRKGETWKRCTAKLIETENDGLLKLECEGEKAHTTSLQLCSQVHDVGPRHSRDFVLELLLLKKALLLSFDTAEDALEWRKVLSRYSKDSFSHVAGSSPPNHMRQPPAPNRNPDARVPVAQNDSNMEYNVAYELSSKVPEIDVEVRTSPLSEKLGLHGKLKLIIEVDKLTVRTADFKKSFSWEYKTIRKYGRDRQSFSMEVGRRSPTGPGVLVFITRYGNDIFQRVQKNTIAINSRPAATPASGGSEPANKGGKRENYSPSNGQEALRGTHPAKTTSPVPVDSEYSTIEDSRSLRGRTRNHPPPEEEYAHAQDLKGDAWKTHGRMAENVHTEFYIGVEKPSKTSRANRPTGVQPASKEHLYGQVNKNPAKTGKGAAPNQTPVNDANVYSSLDHGPKVGGHPPQPLVQEGAYDVLERPGEHKPSAPPAFSLPAVSNGDEYDCLARGVGPPRDVQMRDVQNSEDVYNVIERPMAGNERLVNLIDDGSGYMTNAGGAIPQENEYDSAEFM